jgi:organic hydroperoxide reductase OsmC/OhrA
MQAFPHRYSVSADAGLASGIALMSEGLPALDAAPPPEFDGPKGHWSPETLLVAAVASCYVLTFRAVAAVGRMPWLALRCDVRGTVDRVDRVTQFTEFHLWVRLKVPPGTDEDQARQLLARAKHACLITHSLKGPFVLDAEVEVVEPALSA